MHLFVLIEKQHRGNMYATEMFTCIIVNYEWFFFVKNNKTFLYFNNNIYLILAILENGRQKNPSWHNYVIILWLQLQLDINLVRTTLDVWGCVCVTMGDL